MIIVNKTAHDLPDMYGDAEISEIIIIRCCDVRIAVISPLEEAYQERNSIPNFQRRGGSIQSWGYNTSGRIPRKHCSDAKGLTGFRIFIHKKQTEKIKILYRKLANIMGYSNLSLTQKPGLTTFYQYACVEHCQLIKDGQKLKSVKKI